MHTSCLILLGLTLTSCPVVLAQSPDTPVTGKLQTPYGDVQLQNGLPARRADTEKIFDQLDFQRACQTYLWALPIVSFAEWQSQHETVLGAKDAEFVQYNTYQDRIGILTPNATTPYILAFANLRRTGPLVIDVPPGSIAGGVGDFWQRTLSDIGETGPDRGKGAKYLVLGPGQSAGKLTGYRILQSPTFNVMIGIRSLEPDPQKSKALVGKLALYPASQSRPKGETKLISPEGKAWSQTQPRGLDYWKRLHAIIQEENVLERDRMMMAMLAPLGIEKGKPFAPDERQQKLLISGAENGELMAISLAFTKRFAGGKYRPGTNWGYVLDMKDPNQEDEFFTQLDQRAAWCYEAVTATKGMMSKTPGEGQAYLGTYQDKEGHWLDGGKTYTLHVTPNAPAKQFWSLTVYDTRTRSLIPNEHNIGDRSSRADLDKNPDGSVDLFIGPTAPAGKEKNWIPTVPGKTWFAYFRLYGPLQPYLDETWPLPDLEEVK